MDDSIVPPSTQSVSWLAHREAEALIDRTIVDELVDVARSDRDRKRRSAAGFIIGKIGANLADPTCAEILIALLEVERNKYNLAWILDALADIPKPGHVDLSPVLFFLGDSRWLVRHSAIGALKNSASEEAERRLIGHLATADSKYDLVYCNVTLGCIGTPRSIPAIAANIKSRSPDVRDSAKYAIDSITLRHSTPP